MAGLIHPVTIAGGGLAGLSLGIALLRRGAEVTLHEAGNYPRHRVCGEFLSGVRDSTLEKLGIARVLDGAVALATSRWFDAGGPVGRFPVAGRGISRWVLDDRLQSEFVKSGGNLKTGSRVDPGTDVVWAAGRIRTDGRWIGVKCHVHDLALEADLEMHIGSNGYAGLAKIEGGKVNLCGLFRRQKGIGGKDALFQCLQAGGLTALAGRVSRAAPDPDSFCAVAGFEPGRQAGPPFSVGDAAWMIPPFTGNGMSMAFEAAEAALDPILEFAAGRISWAEAGEAAASAQRRRFARRMRVSSWLHGVIINHPSLAGAAARCNAIPFGILLRLLR
jgi:flavin-dependent dehydrogenase